MFLLKKYSMLTAIVSLICILLAGCGKSPQPVQESSLQNSVATSDDTPGQEEKLSYAVSEIGLPTSEAELTADILRGDNWVAREMETRFWGGTLYRFSNLFEMVEEKNIHMGACMQRLAPPYDHWETQGIFYLEEENSDLWVEALAGVAGEDLLLEMRSLADEKRYLARLEWGGGVEILLEISEGLSGGFWYQENGIYRAVSNGGRKLTLFDEEGQQQASQNLTGKVMGFLESPRGGALTWYGFDQEELVLWDRPEGQVQARITGQISQYADFGIGYAASGELVLADAGHVWINDGQETREAFSFLEKDYALEKLIGLGAGEDGAFLFLAELEGRLCLLEAKAVPATDMVEKQEVFIVLNNSSPAMQKLAARYNRESVTYHVTVTAAGDAGDPEEYRRRIQMEMAAGGGPDLLGDWTVNIRECIAQGYLAPLEEAVGDMSSFLETAFMTAGAEGRLYGAPYECYPYFLAVSSQLADASSWTLEEMYEAVGNSPAQVLEMGMDSVGIVMAYGLHDEENKTFIDWEKGESHLMEEPFLELMAFAKEYGDREEYPRSETGERLAEGQIAGVQIVLSVPAQLNRARSCFNGEASCIGYPRERGRGIYMEAVRLYLNKNAENREGALDFLRYLLSEEGQRQYMEYGSDTNQGCWMNLPVRRSLLQECLDRYQQSVKEPPAQSHDDRGIYWEWEKLDQEQEALFWEILDQAVPAVFRSDEIWSMVDEELQPYFSGARSAEDAAQALHSRVQLYLDERK